MTNVSTRLCTHHSKDNILVKSHKLWWSKWSGQRAHATYPWRTQLITAKSVTRQSTKKWSSSWSQLENWAQFTLQRSPWSTLMNHKMELLLNALKSILFWRCYNSIQRVLTKHKTERQRKKIFRDILAISVGVLRVLAFYVQCKLDRIWFWDAMRALLVDIMDEPKNKMVLCVTMLLAFALYTYVLMNVQVANFGECIVLVSLDQLPLLCLSYRKLHKHHVRLDHFQYGPNDWTQSSGSFHFSRCEFVDH